MVAHPAEELDPLRYHGSVYYCVPAKHGFFRLAGEWRCEESRGCSASARDEDFVRDDVGPIGDLDEVVGRPWRERERRAQIGRFD